MGKCLNFLVVGKLTVKMFSSAKIGCNQAKKPISLQPYRLVLLVLIFSVMALGLHAAVTLNDIYSKDYEIISRLVLQFSEIPEYEIRQHPERREIIVTLENTTRANTVPLIQQKPTSPVIQSVRTTDSHGDRTVVTITTFQPYYLEHFTLENNNYRIVLDIYNKRQPDTHEEKLLFADFFSSVGFHQRAKGLIDQLEDEPENKEVEQENGLISLSKNVTFDDAMSIFDSLFRKKENRRLLNLTDITEPIGFNIEKIHWKSAFSSILHNKQIELEEHEDIYIIRKTEKPIPDKDIKYLDNILIEATFFEADYNILRELGVDWSTVVDGRVQVSADLRSSGQVTQDLLTIRGGDTFTRGTTTVDINTLFRAFAASDKGHIISRPQITVLSGETGNVQDGIDYTILVPGRTAAGEEVAQAHEVQVQSGTIVDVTPVVIIDEDGEKAIDLTIKVERSSAAPDATGYSKTTAEVVSKKILYDGEETVIGGLITRERVSVRNGIPFLKDLPWWVFGIRYLTGYDRAQFSNKELIILIRATILPSVEQRRRIGRDVSEDIDKQRREMDEVEPKLLDRD